jgi:hypothetical protein
LANHGLVWGTHYTTEQTFPGLEGIGGGRLRFDFTIPITSSAGHFLFIEADGIQHAVRLPHEPEAAFLRRKEHDRRKDAYAAANGHILVRIPHTRFRAPLLQVAVTAALAQIGVRP